MIESKSDLFFLSFFVLTIFVCMTANYSPYYIPNASVIFSLACVALPLIFFQKFLDSSRTLLVCSYLLVCLFVWCFHFFCSFQQPNVKLLYELFFACSFLYLKPDARYWIYNKFIRIFAILLFFAIIEYVFILLDVSFVWGESIRPGLERRYYQGVLNLIPYYSKGNIFRFQFITEEPGLIGTLCFFIIATLDKKVYKKECIVFAIAGIISFSLAFYLLVSLWGMSRIKPSNYKYFLFPLVLYALFNGPINEIIVHRVVNGVEQGTIDNRSSQEIDNLYDSMWDDGQIFLGMGNRAFYSLTTGESAGMKKFVIQYGLFGFILCFISFSVLYFQYNRFNYTNVVLLSLFWLSFYQRDNLNLGWNTIVLFSYGTIPVSNKKIQIELPQK